MLNSLQKEVKEVRMSGVLLVPFGPTRPVPKGHRWCFVCDGSGSKDGGPCEICKGKGHWNDNDIAEHHQRHPEICRLSCGERHISPFRNSIKD